MANSLLHPLQFNLLDLTVDINFPDVPILAKEASLASGRRRPDHHFGVL